jgi:hypothetical protein
VTEGVRAQGRGIGGLSHRTAAWLAWSMCALSLVLTTLSLLLLRLNLSHPGVHIFDYWIENTVVAASFSTVGAVIISRHPNNVIGWLLCAGGFAIGLNHFSTEYAIYSLVAQPGSLPGATVFTWLAYWVYVPALGSAIFLFLLFPTGRLPSSRWRWFAGLSAVATLVGAVCASFSSGTGYLGPLPNPLGIESIGDLSLIVSPILYILGLLAVISMLSRLRRGTGIERQQIKWFAYAGAVTFIGGLVQHNLFPVIDVWWVWWVGFVVGTIGLLGQPVALGIAILRYRLYEIDLIINRTLVYGSLTAMLVGVYVGTIVLLQELLRTLTGQESQLAIVASTLAVAALFTPLRRLIQGFIDRRFYRRKYDAAKTLEAFSAKLRDETDLDALNAELVGVVRDTMQPAHVSLWLRPDTPLKGEQAN